MGKLGELLLEGGKPCSLLSTSVSGLEDNLRGVHVVKLVVKLVVYSVCADEVEKMFIISVSMIG